MALTSFAFVRYLPGMRRPPKKHLLHQLAALPWPVSIAFALFAFSAVRWLLPALAGSNVVLRSLAVALHDRAWWFAVPFLVVAKRSPRRIVATEGSRRKSAQIRRCKRRRCSR